MSTSPALAPPLDRRRRRRQESIEEVLDTAVEIMAEQGVGGLSLGELARRMGIRPPSLYVYFPSKNALYDALFARGAERVFAVVTQAHTHEPTSGRDLAERLLATAECFVGWCLENPTYAQLLFWRPVPGFAPSAEAYEPAVRLMAWAAGWVRELQAAGLLRADAEADAMVRDFTILTSGVVSQQLSNAPGEAPSGGRFVAALPELVEMFARHYGAPATPKGRTRHAHRG